MQTIKQIYDFFLHLDLQALYANAQAIGLSILTFLGVLSIACTVLAQICKKIQDLTDDAKVDGVLGKIIDKLNRVSKFGSGVLHLFPTWGTNPATKALKDRLDELEGQKVNPEAANDRQA